MMLLALAEEQQKIGFKPFIASIGKIGIGRKPIEVEAYRRGLNVVPFRMRPGYNAIGAGKILKFAGREGIDMLHMHGYKGNILFGFIPKPFLKIPRVTTLHGWTNTGRFNRMWVYEFLDAFSHRFMDAVVLVSEEMRSHPRICKKPTLRLEVVSNGIPDALPSQIAADTDSAVAAFCASGPTVGTIGRLSAEKGHALLLDAMKLLKPDFPNLHLVIIGDGSLRQALSRKAEEVGLAPRVHFAGYRDNACTYLPLLDAFVLPSLTEGLPITLLEAMRAGCPIVATAVGGIPAALENGAAGILVLPGDAAKLAEGIRSMLNNPETSKFMAMTARKIFENRFSSRRMAEGYTDIYRSVIP